jgi:hypothetical protein
MYRGSIIGWWGGMFPIYLFFYITSVATIFAALTKKTASVLLSITMMVVSAGLLVWDLFMLLGFAASLNGTPMKEMGIMPFVNFLHLPANMFILIDSCVNIPELRIPFEKIPAVKKQPSLVSFFKIFNILDVVAVIALCSFFLYLTDGKEHAYHGGSFSENKVVNQTIRYLEDRYGEDINMYSSAGPKGEVHKYADPDWPGRNTYYLKVFWKYEAITCYVEILPNGKIEVYKENFMSRMFSHELEEYLDNYLTRNFPCDIDFEDFVSPDSPIYTSMTEYFENLPEGTCIELKYKIYDLGSLVGEKEYLKSFVKSLPHSLTGNFVIGLYATQEDGVYTTISIPYAHNAIYFDQMSIADDSYFNRAIATLFSMDPEYVYSQIRDRIDAGKLDEVISGIDDFDKTLLQVSDPVQEYLTEGWNSVYFSSFRECYPIAYDGKMIAVARLTGEGEDCHYEIFVDDIPSVINENNCHDIAFFYDPEYVYVYDAVGDKIYFAGTYEGEAANRWGPSDRPLDEDVSTEEIDCEAELDFGYVHPVNIEILYSLGY